MSIFHYQNAFNFRFICIIALTSNSFTIHLINFVITATYSILGIANSFLLNVSAIFLSIAIKNKRFKQF